MNYLENSMLKLNLEQANLTDNFVRDVFLTVILRGRAGYELIYITNEAVGQLGIISSYPASPGRITVLVNFQAVQQPEIAIQHIYFRFIKHTAKTSHDLS